MIVMRFVRWGRYSRSMDQVQGGFFSIEVTL